jgi:hypothetical protein
VDVDGENGEAEDVQIRQTLDEPDAEDDPERPREAPGQQGRPDKLADVEGRGDPRQREHPDAEAFLRLDEELPSTQQEVPAQPQSPN